MTYEAGRVTNYKARRELGARQRETLFGVQAQIANNVV